MDILEPSIKAEGKQQESEEKFSKAFDVSPNPMAITTLTDGRYIDVNNSYTNVTGYARDEIIGRTSTEIGLWLRQDDRDRMAQLLQEQGKVRDLEFELRMKSGETRVGLLSAEIVNIDGQQHILSSVTDITERKRMEEKLRIASTYTRSLIEASLDPLVTISPEGKITDVNKTTVEVTGISREKLIGTDFSDYFTEPAKARKGYQTVFEKGYVTDYPLTIRHTSGKTTDVLYNASLYKDEAGNVQGVFAAARDITERKRMEEALENSEEKYRLLVENANETIIVAQDGILKFANPNATELSGYTNDELTSMPFVNLIHPDDREMVAERHMKRLNGEELPRIYPFRIIDKNGNTKCVEINAVRITWQGKPATLNLLTDITERKQVEEKLRRSHEKLERAIEGTIEGMASMAETRDPYTAGHQRRVAKLALAIAEEMGLTKEQVKIVHVAGILHDIGKVGVPAEILSKPSKLSELEFNLIRNHPQVGRDILKTLELPWKICPIVLQHHERMDGSGYPKGTSGKDIIIEARILAVADTVEAMSSHRPYRPSLSLEKALEEISQNRGILYDTDVVDACLRLFNEKGFKLE